MAEMFLEPIPAQLGVSGANVSEAVLLLGVLDGERAIFARADGRLEIGPLDWIVTDWRYKAGTRTWEDVNRPPEEDLDDEDD